MVLARGTELPHAPQDPRRRRRSRLHRRRRRRRPLARPRAGHGALARHAGPQSTGRSVRLLEAAFYENFIETWRHRDAESSIRRTEVPQAPDGQRDRRAELADRRQQRSEAALPAGDRRGARDPRHQLARTSSPTNRSDWALEEAVGRGVKIRVLVEGRCHRRDAREVREPRCLRTPARARASRSTNTSRR